MNAPMTRNEILNRYPEDTFLFLDGHDQAILGVMEENFEGKHRIIYSVAKIIEKLEEEMTPFEAYEYFSFNIEGAYVGEQTPVFCQDEP